MAHVKRNNPTEKSDFDKTFDDWKKSSKEVLVLLCTDNNLESTGNKEALSNRIFEHFQTQKQAAQQNTNDDTEFPNDVNNDISLTNDENEEDSPFHLTREEQRVYDDTFNGGGAPQLHNTTTDNHTHIRTTRGDPTPSPDNALLQTLVDQIGLIASTQTLHNAEVKALRSELGGIKRKMVHNEGPPPAKSERVHFENCSQNSTTTSTNNTTGNPFPSFTASHSPSPRNPYRPPALLKPQLDLIEKGEYVDFNKLKPKSVDAKTRDQKENNVALEFASELEGYKFTKVQKDTVLTFMQWMEAWNVFVQARLHFKPTEQYELFSYQKHITHLASQFRFLAVYAYDIDYRTHVAAERQLSPEDRTVTWGLTHDELKAIHLGEDRRLPLARCFKCNETDHLANKCTNTKSKPQQPQQQQNQSFRSQQQPQAPRQQQLHGQQRSNNYNTRSNSNINNNGNNNTNSNNRNESNRSSTYCNRFNSGELCFRGESCRYIHKCNRCDQANHAGANCLSNTSTSFRPAQ